MRVHMLLLLLLLLLLLQALLAEVTVGGYTLNTGHRAPGTSVDVDFDRSGADVGVVAPGATVGVDGHRGVGWHHNEAAVEVAAPGARVDVDSGGEWRRAVHHPAAVDVDVGGGRVGVHAPHANVGVGFGN
jgi:hypothetical protein